MSTQAQKNSHGHLGNELLKPMAMTGDAAAEAILADRGNVLTPEGKLRKTRTTKYRDAHGMQHEVVVVVEDGKMVGKEIDGVPITGNIVSFT